MRVMTLGNMKVSDFLVLSKCLDGETVAALQRAPKPGQVAGVDVPDDLAKMKVGLFIDLAEMKTDTDILFVPCKELLRMSDKEIMDAPVYEVYGFSRWVVSEVERIGKLFGQCRIEPTAEERQAGAGRTDNGWFGLIDWFARRMGITDHDYVLKQVGIMRVWNCMKIDAETRLYERRLNEVYKQKAKRR